MTEKKSRSEQFLLSFFEKRKWRPLDFQHQAWEYYSKGFNGLINAPTGSGKTYSLFFAFLFDYYARYPILIDHPETHRTNLSLLWITPIKALAEEIRLSVQRVIDDLKLPFTVGIRTGDTDAKIRQQQSKQLPDILITTPESMHLMFTQKGYAKRFTDLKAVVVDEWHELLGTKRGVQTELVIANLYRLSQCRIWGISATIGNLNEAMEVLLGDRIHTTPYILIRSDIKKQIEVESVIPDNIEKFPWAGHLGIKMLDKVIPLLRESRSTLIFTNTRSQSEIWYQKILEKAPEFAGEIAMHHGSISAPLRSWVESALHEGRLKVVVCTSSLDLGVDFRPVERIIQIGGPKGVARFIQRAGRSGHSPGSISKIYFVPTHSLELIEAAALREAVTNNISEERLPVIRAFDVLIQYLVTLSLGDGFDPGIIWQEIKSTHAFDTINEEEWLWVLHFIKQGGDSLEAYEEYSRVSLQDGLLKINSKRMAMRHRLSIGTIVGDAVYKVKYLKGTYLGTIEESFISKLNPGDSFWFAGKNLQLYQIRNLEVLVRKSTQKTGRTPSWMGGRMPLSSRLSAVLRHKLEEASFGKSRDKEIQAIQPLLEFQKERSVIPAEHQFLIETTKTTEGFHAFFFPYEGRFVHEGLASLVAWRISRKEAISFSLAYNDYGFELLSDQWFDLNLYIRDGLFSSENLLSDLLQSVNTLEMARRKFRDIAHIAGLVFRGYPGKPVKTKHLQASSQLFFDVFQQYDPSSLLLKQAYEEMLYGQLEEIRMRKALERISGQEIVLIETVKPSPFAFPIMVDRMREKLSSEELESKIQKMTVQFEKK